MGEDHRTRARGFEIARDHRLTKTPHGQFAMNKVVLLRHGESVWNRENRFTGWADVELTEKGVTEARTAGALLQKEGFAFDVAFGTQARDQNAVDRARGNRPHVDSRA